MSLRLWLPLISDLKNYGNSSLVNASVQSGVTSVGGGKLGKCYKNGGTTNNVATSFTFSADHFTLMAWVRIDTKRSNWTRAVGLAGSGTYMGLGCENTNGTTLGFHYYKTINGTNTSVFDNYAVNVEVGTWVHYAMAYDGTKYYIYKNGALVTSANANRANIRCEMTTLYLFGGTANNYSQSSLNDVRLYDTCLSQKQVKEVSKGLMIHYPLDFGGRGQDNLYDFQSVASKWTNDGMSSVTNYTDSEHGNVLKLVNATANTRIYRSVSNVWTANQVYTVSFLARATTNGIVCNMSRSVANFSPNFTLTTEWKRYSGTITSTETASGGTLSFRIVTATAEVYITNIKLEKGTVCTPYIPGASDPNYTTMGYNNTEFDTSGYKYNGTHTSVTVLNESPRGSISSSYTVAASVTSITNSWALNDLIPELTVAIWFKTNTMNSTNPNWFSLGQNSFIRARIASATSTWAYYNVNGTMKSSTYTTKTLTDNVWHHYAITFKSGVERVYIDGAQVGTTDSSSTGTVLKVGATSWNLAGYTASSEKFIGALSDFRVYGSALSADDIKELYQIPVSIDNSGIVYGTEFNEN